MLGMAPDYDHLPVINKVEVFEHALDSTSGEDLHKVGERRGARGVGGKVLEGLQIRNMPKTLKSWPRSYRNPVGASPRTTHLSPV
jgi:hypothetical protein